MTSFVLEEPPVEAKERNIYSLIFKAKEVDVRTFADIMRKELKKDAPKAPDGVVAGAFDEVTKGDPYKIKTPEFTRQINGNVQIEHGWHHDDYVWHIGTTHTRKVWKVSQDRLVYAVASVLDTAIPRTIKVNIFPPIADWEVKEYTVKALELQSAWNVPASAITGVTETLFKVLNTLV